MAGSQIERVFSVLESLTQEPRGVPMQTLAEQLGIPKSATHRLLTELVRLGYVRQQPLPFVDQAGRHGLSIPGQQRGRHCAADP